MTGRLTSLFAARWRLALLLSLIPLALWVAPPAAAQDFAGQVQARFAPDPDVRLRGVINNSGASPVAAGALVFLDRLERVYLPLVLKGRGNQPNPTATPTAPAGLTLHIEPAQQSVAPGATFSVNVVIDNVANLGGFQFAVQYDPAVATATGATLGPFLASTGRSAAGVGPSIASGQITFGGFSFGAAAGPSGSGVLATLNFSAGPAGASQLHLRDISLLDTTTNPMTPANILDGAVTVGGGPGPTSTATRTATPTATAASVSDWTPIFSDNFESDFPGPWPLSGAPAQHARP